MRSPHDRMMRAGQYEVGDRAVVPHNGHVRRVTGVRRVAAPGGELSEAIQFDHQPHWIPVEAVRPTGTLGQTRRG